MNILSDTLILSRLQFAVTALFHMICISYDLTTVNDGTVHPDRGA
jgi:Cytochrome bd-type quinol oxidase, subunit 1